MAFMEPQITSKEPWYRVETTAGTWWVPADLVGSVRSASDLRDYVEGEPQEWSPVKGYGVRLSAPGYMDATEWEVYTNKREAEARYRELEEEQREENPARSAMNWGRFSNPLQAKQRSYSDWIFSVNELLVERAMRLDDYPVRWWRHLFSAGLTPEDAVAETEGGAE